MINTIDMGKYYRLYLDQSTWPEVITFDVQINGVTNKSSMENITEFNLKDELFTKYEIGLNTYLTISSGDLYIAHKITDFVTGEIDTDPILIPRLAIDFLRSEELLSVDKITFTITGAERRFERMIELDSYLTKAKIELVKQMNYFVNFAGDELVVDANVSSQLKEKSLIDAEDLARKQRTLQFATQQEMTEKTIENSLARAHDTVRKYEKLYNEVYEQKKSITAEKEKNNLFYNDLMKLQSANNEFSQVLRQTVVEMRLKCEEIGVDPSVVPEYEDFINKAKEP